MRLLQLRFTNINSLAGTWEIDFTNADFRRSPLFAIIGPTGSGKSTTLAAMVGHLNQHLDGHILTLEDPVEFIHHSERCLIQQREVGRHCPSRDPTPAPS